MTKVISDKFYILAKRHDCSWGHRLSVAVYDLNDNFLGNLDFACHPEFESFELCQKYSSSELIEIAMERIKIDLQENIYQEAWSQGITICLRINNPGENFTSKKV